MKRLIVAGLVCLALASCSDKQPINERFPTAWMIPAGEERALIVDAIAATNIKDCSEVYIRKNPTKDDEFLLACTKDAGATWRYYYMDLKYSKSSEEAEEDDYPVLKAPNRDSLRVTQ